MPGRFTIKYVTDFFSSKECTLISTEYHNVSQLLEFICKCGRKDTKSFLSFKTSSCCQNCSKQNSFKNIQDFFSSKGCILLSTEYNNQDTILDYICNCHMQDSKSFKNFRTSPRCYNCFNNGRKYSLEYIQNFFVEYGCTLLSKEYININSDLMFLCKCGKEDTKSFIGFKASSCCQNCSIQNQNQNVHSFKNIQDFFSSKGCILLSTEYNNQDTILDYICNCHMQDSKSFRNFRRSPRCYNCYNNERKHSLEYIQNFFAEYRCTLLSKEYINNSSNLMFLCKCGKEGTKTFDTFRYSPWCRNCGERIHKYGKQDIIEYFNNAGCEVLSNNFETSDDPVEFRCNYEGCDNIDKKSLLEFKRSQHCRKCTQKIIENTCMEKYGVRNPSQVIEFHEKKMHTARSYKTYTFPSGKQTLYQGYENYCLDSLIFNEKIDEDDIINLRKDMPVIKYEYKGKTSTYFPDILISSKNLIIEVKSTYTFKKDVEKNMAKGKGVIDSGYNYHIRVYANKGKPFQTLIFNDDSVDTIDH